MRIFGGIESLFELQPGTSGATLAGMKFPALLLAISLLAGCCDDKSIPAAMRGLDSSSAHDRSESAMELARCGEKASRAVPRLSQLLYDDNVGVQSSAAYALRKIGTPDAKAALDRAVARRKSNR